MHRRKLVISLVGILVITFGALVATLAVGDRPQLGLDLQGGASVTLRPVCKVDSDALDVIPGIYRSRIDSLGVAEPEILRQGDTIIVNLPGVKDKQRAIDLIGVTGKVIFRPVAAVQPLAEPIDRSKIPTDTAPTTTVSAPPASEDGATATTTASTPDGSQPAAPTTTPETTPSTPSTAPETTHAGSDCSGSATAETLLPTSELCSSGAPQPVPVPPASGEAIPGETVPGEPGTTEAAGQSTPASAETSPAQGIAKPRRAAPTSAPATEPAPVDGATTTTTSAGTTAPGEQPPTTQAPVDPATLVTPATGDNANSIVVLPSKDGRALYQLCQAFALGEAAIESATAQLNGSQWEVAVTLRGGAAGIDAWNNMTAYCYQSAQGSPTSQCPTGQMAIVLDHQVLSAPVPQQSFFQQRTISITGNFTQSEANDLARVLRYGSTPIEMKAETAQTVSATLGKDSLRAAIISGLVGIGLVVLLMILYYRSLAWIVIVGLILSAAMLWAVISVLSRTSGLALTLAGVTGIIVSIGITVDSFVVFFERLKDEVRAGRSLRSSAQRGWKSAWRTTLAADLVSLIGALVLWYLSVGSVRGFAFFLGVSTLCDLIVMYYFTRPAVLLLAQTRRFGSGNVLGIGPTTPQGGAG